jgi:uncharacterized damage-inducible protein DinB
MMTTEMAVSPGDTQAQRLESVMHQLDALLSQPAVGLRLRQAPGENEWNVLQTLGHLLEMIPYWLDHARRLIEAPGEPPPFGRALDSPERLEGVERGAMTDPGDLVRQLREQVRAAAETIRGLSPGERAKAGIHARRGLMKVDDLIETFVVAHAEDHMAQVRAALGS